MKNALKWNFRTKEYEDTLLPDEATTYCGEMAELVKCASCRKLMFFGDGYTSRRYHTQFGMGYCVCAECYSQEWKEEKDSVAKTARDYLDVELEDDVTNDFGGTSCCNETLRDFLEDTGIPFDTPLEEVNKALVSCGIMPING